MIFQKRRELAYGLINMAKESKQSIGEKIAERLNEFADVLEKEESITEHFNCRRRILDLKARPYDQTMVKETRASLGVSQTVFALFLGVSPKTVQLWEKGAGRPSRVACRFMDEIQRQPELYRKILGEASSAK